MPQVKDWGPYSFGKYTDAQIANQQQSDKKGIAPFPLLPGRALYEMVCTGSANVGPVNKLIAFTLMDAEPVWPATALGLHEGYAFDASDPEARAPFYLYDVVKRAIVESEMCAYYGPAGVQWLDWLLEVEPYCVKQRVDPIGPMNITKFYDYQNDPAAIVRIYELQVEAGDGEIVAGTKWTVRDVHYTNRGEEVPYRRTPESPVPPLPGSIPAELFFPFPFGKSVIYRAGRTIQRLLEIADDLRVEAYAQRMKVLNRSGGATPGTADKVREAQSRGDRVLSLPDGYTLTASADQTPAAMLLQEREALMADLEAITNTVTLNDAAQKSGRARILEMQPMLNDVRRYRRNVDQVYAAFGAMVKWPPLLLSEMNELETSLRLYTGLYNTGSIGLVERNTLNRNLVGLDAILPDDITQTPSPDPNLEVFGEPKPATDSTSTAPAVGERTVPA